MNVSVIALVAIVNVTVLVAIVAVNKSITTYSFDKYFLDKLKEAGDNENEKINLFKNILTL